MKRLLMVSFLLLVGGFIISGISSSIAEGAEKGKPQTICPVLGGPIDKSIYTDYKGYRIYFCCSSCIDDFKKNPEKYMKIIKDRGETPEKSPEVKKGASLKGREDRRLITS